MPSPLTVDDVIQALCRAEVEQPPAARRYWTARRDLVLQLFGLTPHRDEDWSRWSVIDLVAKNANRSGSVFEGLMEAPSEIIRIYQEIRGEQDRDRLVDTALRRLLLLVDPTLAGRLIDVSPLVDDAP